MILIIYLVFVVLVLFGSFVWLHSVFDLAIHDFVYLYCCFLVDSLASWVGLQDSPPALQSADLRQCWRTYQVSHWMVLWPWLGNGFLVPLLCPWISASALLSPWCHDATWACWCADDGGTCGHLPASLGPLPPTQGGILEAVGNTQATSF